MSAKYCIIPRHLITKPCTKCRVHQPLCRFPSNKKMVLRVDSICKDCKKATTAEWRKSNPNYNVQYQRQYRIENVEMLREKRAKIAPKRREYVRRWRAENPESKELHRQREQIRRAIKQSTCIGEVPSLDHLLAKQGGMCGNCKCKGKKVRWEVDHIMPLALGGSHTADNLQVLCKPCNARKWAKTPAQWAAEQGRLL